jgi:hypothetical protein
VGAGLVLGAWLLAAALGAGLASAQRLPDTARDGGASADAALDAGEAGQDGGPGAPTPQESDAGVSPDGGRGAVFAPDAGGDGGVGATAAEDEALATAQAEFGHGNAAFRRGDYIAAARHFHAAYAAMPDPIPLYNEARSWERANEVARALVAFQQYLAAAPHAPDRGDVLERIEALRARPVEVFVSSEPPGAFVYLDGDAEPQSAVTPLVLHLAPGPHVLVLDREAHRRAVRRFEVEPGIPPTLFVSMEQDPGYVPMGVAHGRVNPRILNRRSTVLFSPRFSLLFGIARPWGNRPFDLSIAGEATAFVGRSLSAKLHVQQLEPLGAWTMVTADFGYVFRLEDLDLGFYAFAGSAYGNPTYDCYVRGCPRTFVIVAGGEFRADWVFHPHLALGLDVRIGVRDLFSSYRVETLPSFGLSFSLFL